MRAGASLVTLCPNELYAKQIPPILRSHGETQAGQKHGDIYINTEYSGFGIRNLYFTREFWCESHPHFLGPGLAVMDGSGQRLKTVSADILNKLSIFSSVFANEV